MEGREGGRRGREGEKERGREGGRRRRGRGGSNSENKTQQKFSRQKFLQAKISYSISFCKVGGGYNGDSKLMVTIY